MVFPREREGANIVPMLSTLHNTSSMTCWTKSGAHLSPMGRCLYLYLPNRVTMTQSSWLGSSSSNV